MLAGFGWQLNVSFISFFFADTFAVLHTHVASGFRMIASVLCYFLTLHAEPPRGGGGAGERASCESE